MRQSANAATGIEKGLRLDQMTKLLILGAGSMAVEVLDIAEVSGEFEVVGFVVDRDGGPVEVEGRPVYRFPEVPLGVACVAGIVSNQRRALIEKMAELGQAFASVIHPGAQISRRARIGQGCVVHPGVIVASNTVIGPHCLLNRGALIGHDNRVEAYTTIGPGANLAGGLEVGPGAYLGVGCVIRDHLVIGAGAVVAAGAVVVNSVEPNTLVGGLPARVLKTGVDGL